MLPRDGFPILDVAVENDCSVISRLICLEAAEKNDGYDRPEGAGHRV
jgi:hypothetical protein